MRYYNNYLFGDILELSIITIVVLGIIGITIMLLKKRNVIPQFICNKRIVNLLTERYVRGEISQEEYEQKLKVIKSIKN